MPQFLQINPAINETKTLKLWYKENGEAYSDWICLTQAGSRGLAACGDFSAGVNMKTISVRLFTFLN